MSFAKAEIREPSHSLRDDHWDQASTHSWFDVGHVQRPIKQLEDLELDEWEWSKAFRLHAGSGAAHKQQGSGHACKGRWHHPKMVGHGKDQRR